MQNPKRLTQAQYEDEFRAFVGTTLGILCGLAITIPLLISIFQY